MSLASKIVTLKRTAECSTKELFKAKLDYNIYLRRVYGCSEEFINLTAYIFKKNF